MLVTVTLTSDPNVVFKGVFVQARRLNNCSDTTPVGTFRLAASEGGLELMQCSGVNVSSNRVFFPAQQFLSNSNWAEPNALNFVFFSGSTVPPVLTQ